MVKKIFAPCEVKFVKIDECDIVAASGGPSLSCPSDGLFCGTDECLTEDF